MSVSSLNRRDLIRSVGALAAGAIVGAPRLARTAFAREAESDVLDVAIVGGGVAGAYCAWRLASADAGSARMKASGIAGPPRVALFEASERIGGRLWSFAPPGMPHLRAELGGMRIPTYQTLVVSLVDRLGIQTVPFPMGDDRNLRYLRGRRFTVADLDDPKVIPYDLPPGLRGKSPDDLLIAAIESYIPNAAQLSEAEWSVARQSATFEGVPLRDLGFRYLMERALPDEAHLFVRDEAGIEDFTLNGSAADLMHDWASDFAVEAAIVAPLLGMEEIPRSLTKEAERAGATVARGHRLRRVTPIPDASSTEPALRLELETADGDLRQVAARHVVLAMPPRAIALLAADSLPLAAPSYPALRDALIPITAGKGFLGYERPWWRDLGLTSGRSISDLPLRLTYYMGVEGERPGANPADMTSLLMPTYAESLTLDYWMSFRRQDPETPGGAPFQRPEIGPVPDELAMPERAVAEMQRQLKILHGPAAKIGEPTMAVMSDWGRDPHGAGYHVWAAGANAWEMVPLAREPVPGFNLSICGEAWSTRQGWSLGALMTAERVMQERFGLAWPAWLPADVDLGP